MDTALLEFCAPDRGLGRPAARTGVATVPSLASSSATHLCRPLPAPAPAPDFGGPGLYDGTLLATTAGWRRVENLHVGDQLLTLDNGPVRLSAITACAAALRPASPDLWPRLVPDGALGNRGALRLRPGQEVMVESPLALPFCGDEFARVAVRRLDGFRGITAVPPLPQARLWQLGLESDQVLFAEGDLPLFCAGQNRAAEGLEHYPALGAVAAAGLLTLIAASDRC